MNEPRIQAEKRAKRFWVSLVVGLLSLQIVIGGVAITLATNDPSVAVIPNYHAAALDWDAAKRSGSAAERLGWTVSVEASEIADGRGMRAVQLNVRDETGEPVDHLRVAGSVYHHARAGKVEALKLPSVGEGRYLTMAAMREAGLWQINLSIEGASEPMRTEATIEIASEGR